MPSLQRGQVWVKKIKPVKMDSFVVSRPVLGRWVEISTVAFLRGTSPSDVRDSLVTRDDYPANICVVRK